MCLQCIENGWVDNEDKISEDPMTAIRQHTLHIGKMMDGQDLGVVINTYISLLVDATLSSNELPSKVIDAVMYAFKQTLEKVQEQITTPPDKIM